MTASCQYDVFLSFAGSERPMGRALSRKLRDLGLRVFLDEDSINLFDSITQSVAAALCSSKALVVCYSREYAIRTACQRELMMAFVAGQREGDPRRRIMVINPEAGVDHIVPIELADAKYARVTEADTELAALAKSILHRVESISGVIGNVGATSHPRWHGWPVAAAPGSGSHADLWRLHSVLHSVDFPFTYEGTCSSTVGIVDFNGQGVAKLLWEYASQFGNAFGDIYWLDLGDVADVDVPAEYFKQVRHFAASLNLPVHNQPDARLMEVVGRWFADQSSRTLWLVEAIPVDLNRRTVAQLIVPAAGKVRTVLVCRRDIFSPSIPVMEVM